MTIQLLIDPSCNSRLRFLSVSQNLFREILGKTTNLSTIRTARFVLFWGFSRTLLMSQSNSSVVFSPICDICWLGCHHPLFSPWGARSKDIVVSTHLPVVDSGDMYRHDFTLV
jgi:hypothetical protein